MILTVTSAVSGWNLGSDIICSCRDLKYKADREGTGLIVYFNMVMWRCPRGSGTGALERVEKRF